ncbi:MAG TPA: quinonprotein alcohol dehydrogenase, partial [Casimicrobiaceae bacterium]
MFECRTLLRTAFAASLAMSLQAGAQEVGMSATTTMTPMAANLAPVSDAMLAGSGGDTANWLQSNGSYAQTRYYPEAQISTRNVGRLKPV